MFSGTLKTGFAGILSIATAMTLTFAGAMAEARSGEGRNGPDLEGDSIPLSVDRLLTADDLKKAQDTCFSQYVGGYLLAQLQRKPFAVSRNIKSAGSNLEQARLGHDYDRKAVRSYGVLINGQLPESLNLSAIVGNGTFRIEKFTPSTMYAEGAGRSWVNLNVELINTDGNGPNHFLELYAAEFPMLVFDAAKDLQKVDELGNITEVIRSTNIRLIGNTTADSIKLRNARTKAMTALEVSPKMFVQCLNTELSK